MSDPPTRPAETPRATTPASLRAYRLASVGAASLASPWLRARVRSGKEDPERWRERLGYAAAERRPGRLAWLHGVSVGESLALLPLAERLARARPDVALLVTSGTRASAEILARRLPEGAVHQFAPIDIPHAVDRFLDHWRPDIGVFVESELWPNLILAARARGVRLALMSARLSDRSLKGWSRAPAAAAVLLRSFSLILARDARVAKGLAALGAHIDGIADLKFGAEPLPADPEAIEMARRSLGGRPLILAASTHAGEDELIMQAYATTAGPGRATLVIAPRHPTRGEAIERTAQARGLSVSRRAAGGGIGAGGVYVADTVGELGVWYRLARLAVIGGSLSEGSVGGHNPLEPARLECAFIAGHGVQAWPVYQDLAEARATALVAPDDLADWFGRATSGDPSLAEMAARARALVAAGDAAASGAGQRILDLLDC